jgi:hypothetical protein
MSVYRERQDELERFELMMGIERGRLAVALDLLTDALVLVGQHGVYCQSARQPGRPAMDIQLIAKGLNDAKELISGVMDELKRKKAVDQETESGSV